MEEFWTYQMAASRRMKTDFTAELIAELIVLAMTFGYLILLVKISFGVMR